MRTPLLGTRGRLAIVVVAAFVVQTTLFTEVRVAGVVPELMLLVAIYAGRLGGPHRGAVVGFLAGLLYDVQLVTPLGLWALACCLVAWVMGAMAENLHRPGGVLWMASAGIASALGVTAVAAAGELMGQPGMVSGELLRIALLVGAMNLVLSPLAARALRWAMRPSMALQVA